MQSSFCDQRQSVHSHARRKTSWRKEEFATRYSQGSNESFESRGLLEWCSLNRSTALHPADTGVAMTTKSASPKVLLLLHATEFRPIVTTTMLSGNHNNHRHQYFLLWCLPLDKLDAYVLLNSWFGSHCSVLVLESLRLVISFYRTNRRMTWMQPFMLP